MRVLGIQNCEIEGFGYYETRLSDRDIEFVLFPAFTGNSLPPQENFDAILVGGTPVSAYEAEKYPFLVVEQQYLRSAIRSGKPCLGICCGAQLIAQTLGAQVHQAKRKEIGVYTLELTTAGQTDPLLNGFPDRFPAFQWGEDSFDIPPDGELLVTGAVCRNQMFSCGSAVGLQFHLEIGSDEAARWANAYPDELLQFGKSRHELLSETRLHERQILRLGAKLLDNFLELVEKPKVS